MIPLSALWTFPTIIFSAFLIGWGAEASQYYMSQGLALAILALLQTLPEFAVEAVIAWQQNVHLMLANLTGSLRILIGLGWPMIYFTRAAFGKWGTRRWDEIVLEEEHCVEVLGLLAPLLYVVVIAVRGSLHFWDGAVLLSFYIGYLWLVQKVPPKEAEDLNDMPWIPRLIVKSSRPRRITAILLLFGGGGLLLYLTAEHFLDSMLEMAVVFGISSFVFVQWVAPFLSEFPEKVTAFNWARQKGKSGMALMNMVSSNINQWTLLVFMMMGVYSISRGEISGIILDEHQKTELWLTWVQSVLALLFLIDMRFRWYEAAVLFVLWAVQFALPESREEIIFVYAALVVIWFGLLVTKRRQPAIIHALGRMFGKVSQGAA